MVKSVNTHVSGACAEMLGGSSPPADNKKTK